MEKLSIISKAMINIIKISNSLEPNGSSFFNLYPKNIISTENREKFLIDICSQKRVLHFGFLDTPFLENKIYDGTLLHLKLLQQSEYIYGIDIDESSLDIYRSIVGDTNNAIFNLEYSEKLPDFIFQNYNIILVPEVLEHIANPGYFLKKLFEICSINNNCLLCLTVPNAFSFYGFVNSLFSIESVHPDHFFYFSPYTINRLIKWAGFKKVTIKFYSSKNLYHTPGLSKNGIIALCEV